MTTTSEHVGAYLSILGSDDRPPPTLESLTELHRRHLTRVPSETVLVDLGYTVMADHVDVVRGCLATTVTPEGQSETELTTYDVWRGALADGCGLSLAEVDDDELRALFDRQLVVHREFTENR